MSLLPSVGHAIACTKVHWSMQPRDPDITPKPSMYIQEKKQAFLTGKEGELTKEETNGYAYGYKKKHRTKNKHKRRR